MIVFILGEAHLLLSLDQVNSLLDTIYEKTDVSDDTEITFEMNPDDFSESYMNALSKTRVNRLSIGVQSFFNEDLQFMGRAHDAASAHHALQMAQHVGFDQITLDLIYGTPTLTDENWIKNIEVAASYNIPHLSCYALTVEDKTALSYQIQQGKIAPLSDEKTARQFDLLIQTATANGFNQYEISNFCQGESISRHNTKYWMGNGYLGVGPSAHSFDGKQRRWNIANNALYIRYVEEGIPFYEQEELSRQDIFNEMIMTGLRTKWGSPNKCLINLI